MRLMRGQPVGHDLPRALLLLLVPHRQRVFAAHGLRLFDVEELPTHGGSLRIYGCHAEDAEKPRDGRAPSCASASAAQATSSWRPTSATASASQQDKRQILSFLIELKQQGLRIVGYGAPAKGNTLLNYCGVGPDFIDYTCDLNPHKQGHFLPGSHIPIARPRRSREDRPDIVLILPWNLKDEIMLAARVHPRVGRALRRADAGADAAPVMRCADTAARSLASSSRSSSATSAAGSRAHSTPRSSARGDCDRTVVQCNASFNARRRHAARHALPGRAARRVQARALRARRDFRRGG